jgi:demethylmenaquinone methyltransferase/2-methoxy-6-polyprenyl-1,4-benzoquinol methylase
VAKRFDERAARYDDGEFHVWLAEQVATWAGASPGRLLDVGAGTGRASGELGGRTGSPPVVLLDVSAGMLQAARRRQPAAQALRADAHRLPFAEAVFDRIVCIAVDSFLCLGEFGAEAARVLCPGGELVMTVWADPPLAVERVVDAAAQVLGRAGLTIRASDALTWRPPTAGSGTPKAPSRRSVVFSARRGLAP